jgi:hypothetical protein
MDLSIGLTAEKALILAEKIRAAATKSLAEAEGGVPTMFTVEDYGYMNVGDEDVSITISNDDMEDRPEVAEKIIVDLED